jgi:hypothetical protein
MGRVSRFKETHEKINGCRQDAVSMAERPTSADVCGVLDAILSGLEFFGRFPWVGSFLANPRLNY